MYLLQKMVGFMNSLLIYVKKTVFNLYIGPLKSFNMDPVITDGSFIRRY